ncbi:SDR family oxidoreductase [Haloarculaceae archaeon H-GB11]|nr:SDR family oxidoreductase [Haloarculaceae archaeon H-GB11]
MDLLDGATVVVTGGASGIGRATARAAADEGADVVVGDVRESPRDAETTTVELLRRETDADARFVECDVTDRAAVERLVDAADDFGGVDVMVNNAGIFRGAPFLETSAETLSEMLDVNVTGTFFGAQAAAERMVDRDAGGAIVNVSSIAGLRGATNAAAYCASKGAIQQFTAALAAELGPAGIRVNAVYPGTIRTAQAIHDSDTLPDADAEAAVAAENPLRRVGEPADVADAVVYLASDRADYVNGATLSVDGGQFATGG